MTTMAEALFEKFKDYMPGLEPDKLRELISAMGHENWRELSGRTDMLKTSNRLLNEAAELVHVSGEKARRLLNDERVEHDDDRLAWVRGEVSQLISVIDTTRRTLREFATSYTMEQQQRRLEETPPVCSSPGVIDGGDVVYRGGGAGGAIPTIKQRVIRFNFHGHDLHSPGLYRVVVRPLDLVVEHLRGFDGIGGECWQPVEGELRGVLLAELALRKAFGLLHAPQTPGELVRKPQAPMPVPMRYQDDPIEWFYSSAEGVEG